MAASQAHALGQRVVVGHGQAALGGGDDLDGVEAEDGDVGVAAVADGLALVAAADGVRGVLDDAEAVALGEAGDALHVAALPCEMDRHDDLGKPPRGFSLGQLGRQGGDAEVVGPRIDIDEIDVGAAVARAVGAGQEGVSRAPEHVARTQFEGHAGDV